MKARFYQSRASLLCVAATVLVASCVGGSSSSPPVASTPPPAPVSVGNVTVSGNKLLRDGTPWIPHGFYQIAFEVPPGELAAQKSFWSVAQQNYSPAEYTQMKQFGADSVRMQIAQTGADPQNALYSASFVNEAIGAVKAARAAGLTVIISIQDEPQTGAPASTTALPSDATQRVWQQLAPVFGSDRGVMFELFNEPHIGPQAVVPFPPPNWTAWAAAMNQMVQTIRSLGAQNVLVADGLQYAQELEGAPQLNDPLNQVAYAAHPYSLNANDQSSTVWDTKFGNFSATEPVIISEWGIGYYCDGSTPSSSVAFMQYLQAHGIGLEAGAWDWQSSGFGSAMYNFPTPEASTFVGPSGPLTCHYDNTTPGYYAGFGFGELVKTWYQTGTPASTIE